MMRKIAVWILIVAVLNPAVVLAQVASVPAVPAPPAAARSSAVIDPAALPIQIVVGRSTVLDVGVPITRVSLTSADVADALVTSASQLLIHGKMPGTISMFVWERSGNVRRYEVIVGRDVDRLNEQMQQLFPKEGIQVTSNGRNVVLSGTVSSKEIADKVTALSTSFVENKEQVISVLQVQGRPVPQVLLRVRFAEVSRTALTELGLSLFTSPTGIENTLGRITTQQFTAPGYSDLSWTKNSNDFGSPVTSAEGKFTFSDFLNLFILSERYDLGVLIRALQARGLFQSLAEPNLVAESGKEASFLAGGEFPIPVAQAGGGNAITIEFKEFGVRLNFLPVVDGDRVHLRVRPEVSTLDFANGIQLQGFRIPALTSRRTETELELRNGQTFAIAGLLNNSMTSSLQKIPGIGDIPILGYLFRSKAAQKNRTELVVMITPQILTEGSSGVTNELPRLNEPFLSPLRDNESFSPPPGPFPQSGTVTRPAGLAADAAAAPGTTPAGVPAVSPVAADLVPPPPGMKAEPAVMTAPLTRGAAVVTPAATAAPAAVVTPTAAERKAMQQAAERERKAAADAAKVMKAQQELAERQGRAAAAEERRRFEKEQEEQKKLAREQARRDAEEARRKAAEDKRAAEEARRRQEEEKKKQEAIDAAAARVRAAEEAYRAELARSGGL